MNCFCVDDVAPRVTVALGLMITLFHVVTAAGEIFFSTTVASKSLKEKKTPWGRQRCLVEVAIEEFVAKSEHPPNPSAKQAIFPASWKARLRNADQQAERELNERFFVWAGNNNLCRDDERLEKMRSYNLGSFALLVFPFCYCKEKLTLVVRYTAWVFGLDDWLEKRVQLPGGPESVKRFMNDLREVMKTGTVNPAADERERSMCEILWEIVEDFKKHTNDPTFTEKLLQAHELYFDGVLREGLKHTLSSLLALKPAVTGVQIYFPIMEVVCPGAALPWEVFNSPSVQRLHNIASLAIACVNDIVSLDREKIEGGLTNIVLQMVRHHNLSEEAACGVAVDLQNQAVEFFDEVCREALRQHPNVENLEKYLNYCRDLLLGLQRWQFSSPRYNKPVLPNLLPRELMVHVSELEPLPSIDQPK